MDKHISYIIDTNIHYFLINLFYFINTFQNKLLLYIIFQQINFYFK